MISKILIYVDNINYLDDYRKAGVSAFLFGLQDFCVGYKTYSLEEINGFDVSNKYIILNRLLDCDDVDKLKIILNKCKVKGIVFEDLAVYQLVKEMKLDFELILFQNHFGTNSFSINFWLDRLDSMFVSNELTYDEIKNIVNNAKKGVCLHLFGYNQVMYSRRLLLSNWCDEFNVVYKNKNVIEDVATHVKFRAFENEYGTVMYSERIFNGKMLLNLENVKFFYVNTTLIKHDIVLKFLSDINHSDVGSDGFLHTETIYKIRERNR